MFTAHHNEIKDFTGGELVELLRRLLYAEARKAGVPLRSVHVPLQITVADGGQDASILWTGGEASTNFFPGRDIIFQCKAKDRDNVQWNMKSGPSPLTSPASRRRSRHGRKTALSAIGMLDRVERSLADNFYGR